MVQLRNPDFQKHSIENIVSPVLFHTDRVSNVRLSKANMLSEYGSG